VILALLLAQDGPSTSWFLLIYLVVVFGRFAPLRAWRRRRFFREAQGRYGVIILLHWGYATFSHWGYGIFSHWGYASFFDCPGKERQDGSGLMP